MRRVVDPAHAAITGLVLAGGQGSRMGGLDKGLVRLAGRPLIAHVIARLAPQVGTVMINANRNLDSYRDLGHPVIQDAADDYPGPLAGILSGLAHGQTPWIVTSPCDCPFLPTDLVARLAAAVDSDKTIAVAHASGELQPVFALIPTHLHDSLAEFLRADGRKITVWFDQHPLVAVSFDADAAFANVNTPEELAAAEARMQEHVRGCG